MREILFRGKRADNGEWVEGFYSAEEYNLNTHSIEYIPRIQLLGKCVSLGVIPETVGQYTGLTDKNGKKIFEGDIVHVLGNQDVSDLKSVNYNALIAFLDGGFCAIDGTIEEHAVRRYAPARMDFDLEVIGNIHDNPELLEGGE